MAFWDITKPLISIHAPREGSDAQLAVASRLYVQFLSTLPARGATRATSVALSRARISIHAPREGSDTNIRFSQIETSYFYPRSPRGERPVSGIGQAFISKFLSTLPARGATGEAVGTGGNVFEFLSTLPARGATRLYT